MKFILWIWQLPQNIIGFLMTRKPKSKSTVSDTNNFPVYFTSNVFGAGVCLGDYIILDYDRHCASFDRKSMYHEYGRHRQSLRLGWLYLIIVGIPSFLRNIWDRVAHKKWTTRKRYYWYYSGYPEKWADKLGGVKR